MVNEFNPIYEAGYFSPLLGRLDGRVFYYGSWLAGEEMNTHNTKGMSIRLELVGTRWDDLLL